MLLPVTCGVCGASGAVVCPRCAARLGAPPSLAAPLHVDACHAAFAYGPELATLLTGLKNRHRRELVGWMADQLAPIGPPPGALVVWAPTTVARRRARGFDQAELLARALARRWDRGLGPRLRRLPGAPQAGRRGADRRTNPAFAPLRPGALPPGASVVLVDDVITTGATITAAARVLRGAGALVVHAVAAARAARS